MGDATFVRTGDDRGKVVVGEGDMDAIPTPALGEDRAVHSGARLEALATAKAGELVAPIAWSSGT